MRQIVRRLITRRCFLLLVAFLFVEELLVVLFLSTRENAANGVEDSKHPFEDVLFANKSQGYTQRNAAWTPNISIVKDFITIKSTSKVLKHNIVTGQKRISTKYVQTSKNISGIAAHVAEPQIAPQAANITHVNTTHVNTTMPQPIVQNGRKRKSTRVPATLKPINQTELRIAEELYYNKTARTHIVFPFNHTFVLQPRINPCTSQQNLTFIIVVNSKMSNTKKRQAIRETWGQLATGKTEKWPLGNQTLPPMRLLFFLGQTPDQQITQSIEEEHEKHGDIVQGDFIDSYKNMTLKSMLCLKYLKLDCLNVPYVLKSDDDMFLNLPHLSDYLRAHPLRRSFMGPHNPGSRVLRRGKWALKADEFPPEVFPPYESGSAYVMTMDITEELYEKARYIKPIFIDDVYITGIVARLVGNIHRELQPGFAYGIDKQPKLCDLVKNRKFAQTKCSPPIMRWLWHELHDDKLITQCAHETQGA